MCGCVCVHLSKKKKKKKEKWDFSGPGLCERVEGQAWRWCLWWWCWWQEEHQRNLPGEAPVEAALISARCRSNSGLNVVCSWNGARITEGLMTLFPSPVRLQGGGNSGTVPLLRFFSYQSTDAQLPQLKHHVCKPAHVSLILNESCWILITWVMNI